MIGLVQGGGRPKIGSILSSIGGGNGAEDYRIIAGFSLFWCWIWFVFQTTLFQPHGIIVKGVLFPSWMIPTFSYATAFAIIGLIFKTKGVVFHGRGYLAAVLISSCLGAMLCTYASLTEIARDNPTNAFSVGGGLLMGAGTAFMHLEWGRLLSSFGSRRTLFYIITSTICAAAMLMLLIILPEMLLYFAGPCLPIAIIALLGKELNDQGDLWKQGKATEPYVPWKLASTASVQGFAFGVGQAILLSGLVALPDFAAIPASFFIAAVLAFAVALLRMSDFNKLIYQIGFILVAAGFLVFSLNRQLFDFAWLIQSSGFRFVDIIIWSLCAFLVKREGFSANWIFSWTSCLLYGQIAGVLFGGFALASHAPFADSIEKLAIIVIFVVLAAGVLMSSASNIKTGWGMVRPGATDAKQGKDILDKACEALGERCALTPRERDVLLLLAKGRNADYIHTELVISKETVRTHMQNIYRKIGVHSHQDLLNVIDVEEESFE